MFMISYFPGLSKESTENGSFFKKAKNPKIEHELGGVKSAMLKSAIANFRCS